MAWASKPSMKTTAAQSAATWIWKRPIRRASISAGTFTWIASAAMTGPPARARHGVRAYIHALMPSDAQADPASDLYRIALMTTDQLGTITADRAHGSGAG